MKKILFPGSFDPITNAHLEIIQRLMKLGYFVEIGILVNSDKKSMFKIEERISIIEEIIKNRKYTNASCFFDQELLIEVCKKRNIQVVARGIRSIKDYEYEKEMEFNNKRLNSDLEYIYLNSERDTNYISSTVVRELIKYGAQYEHLVPEEVIKWSENKKNKTE